MDTIHVPVHAQSSAPEDLLRSLQDELTALRAEVRVLQADAVRRSGAHDAAPAEEHEPAPIGRRALLGKAAAVLAAGTGMSLLGAQPAFAGVDGDVVLGQQNPVTNGASTIISGSGIGTTLVGENLTVGSGLAGESESGIGVYARSTNGNALHADISTSTNEFNAVYAHTTGTGNAVFGENLRPGASANAVLGINRGAGTGVAGFATSGNGVYARSNTGTALSAEAFDATNAGQALLGINRGPGICIFGQKPAGVGGDAVVGVTNTGRGVVGIGNAGRGGAFTGNRAQVQLVPSTAATHPSSGLAGDLFVDASKRLWFCTGGAAWTQLA